MLGRYLPCLAVMPVYFYVAKRKGVWFLTMPQAVGALRLKRYVPSSSKATPAAGVGPLQMQTPCVCV